MAGCNFSSADVKEKKEEQKKKLGESWRRADLKRHYHGMSHDLIINMCGLNFFSFLNK